MSTDQQQLAKLIQIREHVDAGGAILEKAFDQKAAKQWFVKYESLTKDVKLNKDDPVMVTAGNGLNMLACDIEARGKKEQPDAEAMSGDLTSSQEADDEQSDGEDTEKSVTEISN